MRIVLDTNVLVSGVFFGRLPVRILRAWRDGDIQLVLSAEILEEYQRVGHLLAGRYSGVDLEPFLALLAVHAVHVRAPAFLRLVCADPDDDNFLACAICKTPWRKRLFLCLTFCTKITKQRILRIKRLTLSACNGLQMMLWQRSRAIVWANYWRA